MVMSSSYDNLNNNDGWLQNAIGLFFNPRFGFGLIDAEKMVTNARSWELVAEKEICSVNATLARYLRYFSTFQIEDTISINLKENILKLHYILKKGYQK